MSVSRRFGVAVFAFGLTLAWLSAGARAADEKAKTDATGTWKSSFKTRNGGTRETIFKLKQDGAKLTGTVSGRDGKETKIENGKVEDGKLSFQVTREFNNRKVVIKYQGTVEGDTIKGKRESPGRDGNTRTRDWEAKRASD
jgi:hypothetical protein